MTGKPPQSWLYLTGSILRQIWSHPANRHRRGRALARAVGWQLHKRVRRRPVEIDVFSGMKIRCYPESNSASNLFYFGQYYEYDEMLFLARYLRPRDGFIDGGANIGTYSLMAAGIVGPRGRVDAFEPAPLSARRFRENMALNHIDWVELHEAALNEGSGTAAFLTDWDVSNRIVAGAATEPNEIEVQCVSLDASLPADARYAMAKLDLEGAEVAALNGAERHLKDANPPVWQVEIIDHLLRDMGSSIGELLALFSDHGYDVGRYDADTNRLDLELDPASDVPGRGENLIAVSRLHGQDVLSRLGSGGLTP